jgi:YfiH family protein|tara:strand:+ start:1501 stop:2262 length:762 start_codon:yes stop_codon:yes gene_type:complete
LIKSKKLSRFKDVEHAFFNKLGGKSVGIFKSLNCGPGSSDNKQDILKNLKIVERKIRSNSRKLILLNQIHSNKFCFIDKYSKLNNNKLIGDALITNKLNTPIGVLTADCAPILIFDSKNKIIAAIHAGWKGAFKGIIKKVIKFLIKKGSSTDNITAVIGPCISLKNYEVKQDFIKKFIKNDVKTKIFFKKIKNKNYFNLSQYIAYQLKNLDIKKIEVINKDTFNIKNNFFSARRSKSRNEVDYGRNISVIMIN